MAISKFKKIMRKIKGQGMVEFALVLPLLLLLVFGIIEAGRLLFIYGAVFSSSREAARYGSAAGEITGYIPYYGDCDGIRAAAMRIGRFAGVSATDVSISYDHGPASATNFAICPLGGDEYISLGDRITVQVVATFRPLLPIVNFQPIPISTITRRTIIKDVAIEGTPPSPVTPTISFVIGEQTVDEGVGVISVMLQLTAAIDQTVTVPYSLDGTAINTVDYIVSPNPVVLLPGDTIGEIQITIYDDDIDEDDETAVLIMGNPTNAIKGTPFAHIVTIEDNDDPPVVSFVLADQSHPESIDGLAMLLLSNPSSRDITVNYSVGGDAQGGYDYSLTASPITIPALDLTFPIVIDVTDDLIDEVDETIILTLGDIVNGTKGSPDVHLYTIEDDDDPPDVFFTWADQSVEESDITIIVELQLSIESSKEITVPFSVGGTATQGDDYALDTSPIVIPAGETIASIPVDIFDNDDVDDVEGETIVLTLLQPVDAMLGSPAVHTVNITYTPIIPVVSFSSASQTSNNAVMGKLNLWFILSGPATDDVVVPFSVGGTATLNVDYSIDSSPVTIPAGGAQAKIQVTLYGDAIDEEDETVVISMGTPTNAIKGSPNVHTITFIDNDPEPLLYFTSSGQTVDEDAGTVSITAQLNVMSGKDITVPFILFGSAEEGSGNDYTFTPSPVFIPAGSTSVDIQVDIFDDDIIELSEEVVVTLDTPTNAVLSSPGTHTVVIKDNEPNCPTPIGLPYFGTGSNDRLLFWDLQSQDPLVPTNLSEVTLHWPTGSDADVTSITFGSPIFAGNASPPFMAVNTPNPLWSGAFVTRQMVFAFDAGPKSVSGDFYQVITTFEGCDPISGIIPSD